MDNDNDDTLRSVGDLAALEHQMFRDHAFDPTVCVLCLVSRSTAERMRGGFEFSDPDPTPQPIQPRPERSVATKNVTIPTRSE